MKISLAKRENTLVLKAKDLEAEEWLKQYWSESFKAGDPFWAKLGSVALLQDEVGAALNAFLDDGGQVV